MILCHLYIYCLTKWKDFNIQWEIGNTLYCKLELHTNLARLQQLSKKNRPTWHPNKAEKAMQVFVFIFFFHFHKVNCIINVRDAQFAKAWPVVHISCQDELHLKYQNIIFTGSWIMIHKTLYIHSVMKCRIHCICIYLYIIVHAYII